MPAQTKQTKMSQNQGSPPCKAGCKFLSLWQTITEPVLPVHGTEVSKSQLTQKGKSQNKLWILQTFLDEAVCALFSKSGWSEKLFFVAF